jgi:hypothetical protein
MADRRVDDEVSTDFRKQVFEIAKATLLRCTIEKQN